jgi:hypothetical protein
MRRRLALLGLLLLAGCASPPPPPADPQSLTFGRLPPFELTIGRLDIVDAYRPPLDDSHVEPLFPIAPAAAAEGWARDRLRAVGRTGTATFTILEASAVAVALPHGGGLASAFTAEPETRYDIRLAVRLVVDDPQTGRAGTVSAQASRSQAINQGAAPTERRHLWFTLTAAVMDQLDGELQAQIPRYLGAVLR